MHIQKHIFSHALTFIAILCVITASSAQIASRPETKTLNESFQSVTSTTNGIGAHVSRSVLTSAELSSKINFTVSLPFRNLGELKAKVSNHVRLSIADLNYSYFPLPSSYNRVAQWLSGHGLRVGPEDPNHILVTGSGTVSQVSAAFGTQFAKVTTADGEFTSAIAPAVIPNSISDAVLGVSGLQPHLRAKHRLIVSTNQVTSNNPTAHPPSYTSAYFPFLTMSDIRALYNAPPNLTGSGQTVAILVDGVVNLPDLIAYNSYTSNNSWSGNLVTINVGTPPSADNSNFFGNLEANMDVEAFAGIAPAANIRLYTIPSLATSDIINGLNRILSDVSGNNVSVISMSFSGGEETAFTSSDLDTLDQIFQSTTGLGVTNVASSGDDGSSQGSSYTQVGYPASDPFVTGVGATAIHVYTTQSFVADSNTPLSSGSYIGETLYAVDPVLSNSTGGGVSQHFPRPSWQNGNGTLLGTATHRCVPDVSGPWGTIVGHSGASDTQQNATWQGAFSVIFTNIDSHTQIGRQFIYPIGGTSLAAPVWAGIVALINQNRGGNGPIGYLNPWLYQIGENYSINGVVWNAFRDVDNILPNVSYNNGSFTTFSNSNGAYSTGAGYDLCTGLGTPNIANLAGLLQAGIYVVQPQSQTVAVGSSCVFSAFAEINNPFEIAPATYQWYRIPHNGSPVQTGVTTPQLLVSGSSTQLSNDGDQYYCVVTLLSHTGTAITSPTATLSVTNTTNIGHLTDISTRAYVPSGQPLIAGIWVSGSGSMPVLARATGPSLGQYGVSNYLPNAALTVIDTNNTQIAYNFPWGGTSALSNAFSAVYAFAWPNSNSHDSAILFAPGQNTPALGAGGYSMVITGNSGDAGVALAECYDANPAIGVTWTPGMPFFSAISTRTWVGTGDNVLDGGFYIGGSTSRTVLIRATGPTLANFGVQGALPDPQITLFNIAGNAFAANEVWNNNPLIVSQANAVYAFPWSGGSNDSAIVVTLPPGGYTAVIRGATGDTGVALLEVYLLQ